MAAAARTAGFLMAISESGLVVHIDEIIGAESLSQRYRFLSVVADRMPDLRCIVHDDACHLAQMAALQKGTSALSQRLANLRFVVDEFHSTAHVGQWCKENCLPGLPQNQAVLDNFPTSMAESVNHNFSPFGHTIHHMGPYLAKFFAAEMADIHNIKLLQIARDKGQVAERILDSIYPSLASAL